MAVNGQKEAHIQLPRMGLLPTALSRTLKEYLNQRGT